MSRHKESSNIILENLGYNLNSNNGKSSFERIVSTYNVPHEIINIIIGILKEISNPSEWEDDTHKLKVVKKSIYLTLKMKIGYYERLIISKSGKNNVKIKFLRTNHSYKINIPMETFVILLPKE